MQQLILDGKLKPGEPFPSQRELAETMGASRATIREAISILSTLGLVDVRPGKATTVVERGSSAPRAQWRFATHMEEKDLLEVRRLVESYGAFAAGIHADDWHLQSLRDVVTSMEQAAERLDLVDFSRHDFEFHRRIMEYASNPMLLQVYCEMQEYTMESQRIPLHDHREVLDPITEHKQILTALENRNPVEAFRSMRQHIEQAARRSGLQMVPWDV